MKIFLSGPMTGYPNFNHAAFEALCIALRDAGHEVLSPHENVAPIDTSWADWMKLSIKQMLECEIVVTLHAWEYSKGACIEVNLARKLGMPVRHSLHPEFWKHPLK